MTSPGDVALIVTGRYSQVLTMAQLSDGRLGLGTYAHGGSLTWVASWPLSVWTLPVCVNVLSAWQVGFPREADPKTQVEALVPITS